MPAGPDPAFAPQTAAGVAPGVTPQAEVPRAAERSPPIFARSPPDGQITESCPAPFAKIFSFAPDPNQFTESHRPVPQRGVAQRHQRGAGCSGRGGAQDEGANSRTAKSCGPDAPTLEFKLAELSPPATVAKEPGHRGEREGNR
jgi:hypothetical protein